MLEEALLGAIVGCAGEAGEVDEDGDLRGWVLEGLWGQVEVEVHFAFRGGGGMAQFQELAAEGGDCGFCGDGHGAVVLMATVSTESTSWKIVVGDLTLGADGFCDGGWGGNEGNEGNPRGSISPPPFQRHLEIKIILSGV